MSHAPAPTPLLTEFTTRMIECVERKAKAKLAYTIEEAGELLSISKSKAYELSATGELPTTDIGGCRRVTIGLLLEFISCKENNARRRK